MGRHQHAVCVRPSLRWPPVIHLAHVVADRVNPEAPVFDNIFGKMRDGKWSPIGELPQRYIIKLRAVRLNIGVRVPDLADETAKKIGGRR